MTKVQRLKRAAREACEARGHHLWPFHKGNGSGWSEYYGARCRDCGMGVIVEPNPAPNSIDISGDAVALNCSSH